MKRILYPIVLLLAVSCAKENNTALTAKTEATAGTTDSNYVWLPTGVYTYWNSNSDTTVADRFDSIYYTSDLKIDKVVSTIYPYTKTYTVVNQFVYNADGSIDSLKVTSDYDNDFAVTYLFFYDSNGRLDSLSASYPADSYAQSFWNFSYDANGHIQHVHNDNFYRAYPGDAYYHRNASGELDSITQDLTWPDYLAKHTAIRPGTGVVLNATGVDRAYLFLMAFQINYSQLVNSAVNPYWHQYINPDISLFKNGTIQRTDQAGGIHEPYDYYFEKVENVDATVRWLKVNRDASSGWSFERKDKFIYGKVPGVKIQ